MLLLINKLFALGSSHSGKSWLMAEIIRRRQEIFTEHIDKVIYVYKADQDLFKELRKDADVIFTTDDGILQDYKGLNVVLIYDDVLLDVIQNPKAMQTKFLVSSHHEKYFIFLLCQAVFFNNSRLLTINTTYFIILKFERDLSMIMRFFSQHNKNTAKALAEAYEECVSVPYGYLFISFHPRDPPIGRYRNSVFVDDKLILFRPNASLSKTARGGFP